jgi:hypothetical protein
MDYWACVTFPACRGMVAIRSTTERQPRSRTLEPEPRVNVPAAVLGPPSRAGAIVTSLADGLPLERGAAVSGQVARGVRHATRTLHLIAARRTAEHARNIAQRLVAGRNVAGASAQAEFDRLRAQHRRKMRGALPALVALTLIAMAMAFVVLLSRGLLPAALGAVAAGGIGVWTIGRLPAVLGPDTIQELASIADTRLPPATR